MYASFSELAPAGLMLPDAPCCDDCAQGAGGCHSGAPALGSLRRLEGLPYPTGYGYESPFSLGSGSYFGSDPFGSSYGLDFGGGTSVLSLQGGQVLVSQADRGFWDSVIGYVGDVGKDLLGAAVDWLKQRIGRDTWEAMPEESKQAAIQQAITDLRGSAVSAIGGASPALLLGLALLAFFIMQSPTRRTRR